MVIFHEIFCIKLVNVYFDSKKACSIGPNYPFPLIKDRIGFFIHSNMNAYLWQCNNSELSTIYGPFKIIFAYTFSSFTRLDFVLVRMTCDT